MYALGVVFYEMLFGRCPYEAHSVPALLNTIANSPIDYSSSRAL